MVPRATNVPRMIGTRRDGCCSCHNAVVCVPHHVSASEDRVFAVEMVINAEIEVVRIVYAGACVQAIIGRERQVGRKGAILVLRCRVRRDHLGQFTVDQTGGNLIASAAARRLQPVSGRSKCRTRVKQRHGCPGAVTEKSDSRVLSRFRERIVNRTRNNCRSISVNRSDQLRAHCAAKVSAKLFSRRNPHIAVGRRRIPPALVSHVEEDLVANDRTANRSAEFVLRIVNRRGGSSGKYRGRRCPRIFDPRLPVAGACWPALRK